METEKVHCFEQKGLGKAPFRYVGMEYQEMAYGERVIGSVGGCAVTTKPGGTCAYCHTYIVNMFTIESADGNRFHVGCDCLAKVGETGMKEKADKAIREKTKKVKASREQERIAAARKLLTTVCGRLAEQPHPNEYFAKQGLTLLDFVNWCLENGHGIKAARIIEQNQ